MKTSGNSRKKEVVCEVGGKRDSSSEKKKLRKGGEV